MKRARWQISLVISFFAASVIIYLINYLIFRNARDIFFYTLLDIGFLPIQVLLLTLIINRLLEEREKQERLVKLNMVIGAYFSEVGTELLTYLSDCDPRIDTVRKELIVTTEWTAAEFQGRVKLLKAYDYRVDMNVIDLVRLRSFLLEKREFLLRLLENPNLLEHESFTEMLQAVFHLTEELLHRGDMESMPPSDTAHISGDIKRAYGGLVNEWLSYMQHLKGNYPYLFSLAMRMNPFDQTASPIVR